MSRVKIKFPEQNPLFTANVIVRISDINYGNHLGNDSVLSIVHESRMQMLNSFGYTELNAGGNSLIMADVMIAYKNEGFYGDNLEIDIYATDFTGHSFDLLYHIKKALGNKSTDIAHAKTGMITFDYTSRKITAMNEELKHKLQG